MSEHSFLNNPLWMVDMSVTGRAETLRTTGATTDTGAMPYAYYKTFQRDWKILQEFCKMFQEKDPPSDRNEFMEMLE